MPKLFQMAVILFAAASSSAASANERFIAECADLVRAYTNSSPDLFSAEYSDPLWGPPRVVFGSKEIKCTFDADGLVSDLTVGNETVLDEGWPNNNLRKRFDALAMFSTQEVERLDNFSWAVLNHGSYLSEAARKMERRKSEADRRLKQGMQRPGADIDALSQRYRKDMTAPGRADLELSYRVAVAVHFDEYAEFYAGEVSETSDAQNIVVEKELTSECRKLQLAIKLKPDRSGFVSQYEDLHRVIGLAAPALKVFGISVSQENQNIALALLLSGVFKEQAAQDEANGDPLAHERAAYEWGYSVGDSQTIRWMRFFSEGVQLGAFGAGSLEPLLGENAIYLDKFQDAIGGNGKTYRVDLDYLEDAFADVQISKDGAIEGDLHNRSGLRFLEYWMRKKRC